ncbi:MAG: flagellar biosynthesis protein FlhF [Syntrophomonadaceae bacterium]|jgi:flagellar biosynthesis protein FlhF|nr:flagellar biosynthesis protein FlhF [Syntrophomonadaceae bacterium]
MKIKRFVGDSFPEAIRQAKEQMGNDAVILYSRKYKEGGLFGLFGREKFEITVAVDENYRNGAEHLTIPADDYIEISEPDSSQFEVHSANEILQEIKLMKDMVEELRERIDDESTQDIFGRNGRLLFKHLVSQNVDEKLASRIVRTVEERAEAEQVHDYAHVRNLCVQVMAELIRKPRDIEFKKGKSRVVALIGPTGVGKTTTIAKLAARFSLIEKKKIGLITLDTYRIAAVEQLKIYADIMGLPLQVVYKPGDLKAAVERFSNRDLVFIDTAGRSPRNDEQMAELVALFQEAEPDEVILVLSATTKSEDLLDTFKRFNIIKIDKIIFTKLDETNCYGSILNTIHRTKKRVSYVTNGQNVPDDIELLDDIQLAQMIMGDDLGL